MARTIRELINEGFNYWLKDHDDFRSPFPKYMHKEIKELSTDKFIEWLQGFSKDEYHKLSPTDMSNKFSDIITSVGLEVAKY